MKKIIFAFAALVCCCFSASAQFSLGVGYCNSSLQEKLAYVDNAHTFGNGLFVEAGYDARINPNVSILTKAQAGNWFNTGEFTGGNHYYAKVPVLAKLIFASDLDFKLFIDLGPEFFWHFADNASDEIDFSFNSNKLAKCNLYLTGGLGLDLHNKYRVHISYDRGLLNDFNRDYSHYMNGSPAISRYSADFTASIAYLF